MPLQQGYMMNPSLGPHHAHQGPETHYYQYPPQPYNPYFANYFPPPTGAISALAVPAPAAVGNNVPQAARGRGCGQRGQRGLRGARAAEARATLIHGVGRPNFVPSAPLHNGLEERLARNIAPPVQAPQAAPIIQVLFPFFPLLSK